MFIRNRLGANNTARRLENGIKPNVREGGPTKRAIAALACVAALLAPHAAYAMTNDQIQGEMANIIYCEPGGYVSCDYDGYVNTSGRHEGIDFALRRGAEICSMIDGEVTYVSNASSLSTCAIYDSARDKTVVYLHGNYSVSAGEHVSQGEIIGTEASKGAGSAAHTHIEVRDGYCQRATKSVNDYTLENDDPYPYWESVLGSNGGSVASNQAPDGDVNVCESAGRAKVRVAGWAYDPDDPGSSLDIHVYVGGPAGVGEGHVLRADLPSGDVSEAFGVGGNHRFDATLDTALTGDQPVYVYAIGNAGDNPLLTDSEHWVSIAQPGLPDYDYGASVTLPEGDGTYTIASSLDPRLFVEVAGSSTSDGGNVQLWGGERDENRQWVFTRHDDGTYTIANAHSGKVLDVAGASLDGGANILQWTDGGGDNQRWWVQDCGDGTYALKAKHSRGFLDVTDAIATDGQNIQQCWGNGHAAQRFIISKSYGLANALPQGDGIYVVKPSAACNLCLDIFGASRDNGANLQIWEANSSVAQRFVFTMNADGSYRIANEASGLLLDVDGASRADSANVHQWGDEQALHRSWWLEDLRDGSYAIKSVNSGRCLDIAGANLSSGTNVQQWRSNGTVAQSWIIERA